ncbi:MAG TPA: DsbA family protein [Candidatus Absconditabacterales bacterium]|nr:DsbA family protein [Candidatus Absconditabacterales bacterium]HNG97101.1 DsbA family protein [Candidatus Absconditabacterales bacterium]
MKNGLLNTVLIIITLLLSAFNTFGGSNMITKAIEKVEAMKVGGSENYEIVKKIYESDAFKSQQKQSLEAAQKQMGGAQAQPEAQPEAQPSDTTQPAPDAAKKISLDQVKKIKDSALIVGSKDAKILIVEYSDLQCPFCKRHHDNGTLKSLVDKYAGKVAKTLKQFPLSFHPYAQKAGEAALCYANGDSDKYYKFVDGVFAKTLSSDQIPFDVAKELGANETSFKECVTSGKYAKQVQDEMSEGQSLFGITGTPGNVILNTENGEYVVVAGAYPASEFEKTLDVWTK